MSVASLLSGKGSRIMAIYKCIGKKNIEKNNSTENFHFLKPTNLCLLHGQVFIMSRADYYSCQKSMPRAR